MTDNTNDSLKEKIEKALIRWPLDEDGNIAGMTWDDMILYLSTFTQTPKDLRNDMDRMHIIELTCHNTWILTDDGITMRKDAITEYSEADTSNEIPVISSENDWNDFRRLIRYYIECLHTEKAISYYLKPEKYGRDFYIPSVKSLSYGWFQSIKENRRRITLSFRPEEKPVMSAIMSNQLETCSMMCLGYPTMVYFDAEKQADAYLPVTLIPVKYHADEKNPQSARASHIEVELDYENASLNAKWLERLVSPEFKKIMFTALESFYVDGKLDIKEALPMVLSYSNVNNFHYDPDALEQQLPTGDKVGRRKMCNTAVLFRTGENNYIKNLVKELKALLNTKAEILDRTALAYIYRNPPLENKKIRDINALPFIQSNSEQMQAIYNSLNYPIVQLQGPPGTGKSQVAVNIIANCIYNNEPVLFTSYNHNAVDAIKERASSIYENMNLVQFCIEGDIKTSWYKHDYRSFQDELSRHSNLIDEHITSSVHDDVELVADVNRKIEDQNNDDNRILAYDSSISNLERKLSNRLEKRGCTIENFDATDIRNVLSPSRNPFLKLGFSFAEKKAFEHIKSKMKNSYGEKFVKETDYRQITKALQSIVESQDEIDRQKSQLENLMNSPKPYAQIQDNDLTTYASAMKRIEKNGTKALLDHWIKNISELESSDYDMIESVRGKFSRNSNLVHTEAVSLQAKLPLIEQIRKQFVIEPAWATTLLSMWRASPMLPGIFDLLILDEASQCDVISIIPALFRCRRAIFIGDDQQFEPIITMSEAQHTRIWNSFFSTNDSLWKYRYYDSAAYAVLNPADSMNSDSTHLMLMKHFRCAPEIAEYFNEGFYNRQLKIQTDESRLNYPKCFETKDAIQWFDVKNNMQAEMEKAVEVLDKIKTSGFKGSIGIISPLRNTVDRMQTMVLSKGYTEDDVLVQTSYGFQGGQRDVIILVLSNNKDISNSERNYLLSSKNIYNVAVSRAQACLVVIGDREITGRAKLQELKLLAQYPKPKELCKQFDSIWEKKLYDALLAKGYDLTTQRPFECYRLDLSYETEYISLDIEVDGEAYHTGINGGRKQHDIDRDIALQKSNWKVLRFWVYQLRFSMDECVDRIIAEIQGAKARYDKKSREC